MWNFIFWDFILTGGRLTGKIVDIGLGQDDYCSHDKKRRLRAQRYLMRRAERRAAKEANTPKAVEPPAPWYIKLAMAIVALYGMALCLKALFIPMF